MVQDRDGQALAAHNAHRGIHRSRGRISLKLRFELKNVKNLPIEALEPKEAKAVRTSKVMKTLVKALIFIVLL